MKVNEGSVLKYLRFPIFQSHLGFNVDNTDHITELVNKWFSTGYFRNVDTHFRIDFEYEKEFLAVLSLLVHPLHKEEMEYYEKFGHTI